MRDLLNHFNPKSVIPPGAAVSDNTAQVGAIINVQGYDSLTYVIQNGTDTDADATFTVLLEGSNASDMAGAVAVDDKDLLGTEALAGFTFANDNVVRKLGYIGSFQYTRLTITPSGNSGTFFPAVTALLGHPALGPTPNPPA